MKKYLSRIMSLLLVIILVLSCSIVSMSAATEYTQNNGHGVTYDYSETGKVTFKVDSRVSYGSSGEYWSTNWMYLNGNLATCSRSSRNTPPEGTFTLNKYYLGNSTMRAKTFYWYFVNPSAKLANNASKYNSSCTTYTDNLEAAMADIKKKSPSATVTKYALAHTLIDSLQQAWNNDNNGSAWNEVLDVLNPKSDHFPAVPGNIKVYYCYPGGGSDQSVMSYEYHPVLKIIKSSDSPTTTDDNKNYTFKGITYCVYKSTKSFVTGSSNPDYVGYIELNADGAGYSYAGSNRAIQTLNPGTYYVKEDNDSGLKASGYEYNDTVYTVKVTSDNTLSNPAVLRVSDTPIKPALKIEKYSTNPELTDGNDHYTFKGITYCLYKSTKSFVTGSSNPDYVGYIELNEDGTGYSYNGSNNKIRNLGIGTYYVKEDNDAGLQASGYMLDETVYTVNLTKDYNSDNPYILIVSDEPEGVTGAKIIKKSAHPELTDSNECYTLKGAKFNIYTSYADAQENINPFITEIETDEYGIAHISEITPGNYFVREMIAPKGFKVSEEIAPLSVTSDTETTAEVTVVNEPISDPVRVLLQKRNATTGETDKTSMSGAEYEFKFYNGIYTTEEELNGIVPERTWIFKTDDENQCKYDTDHLISGDELFENGEFPLGTVTVQETKAPTEPVPFYLDDTLYIIPIKEDDDKVVHSYNIPVSDEYQIPLMDIEVKKVWDDDDDRDGVRPTSIRYTVYDHNDNIVDSVDVTEEDNFFYRFTGLPTGTENHTPITYRVEEIITGAVARDLYQSSVSKPLILVSDGDVTQGINAVYTTEFTNAYEPKFVNFSGTKTWDDFNNEYDYRPNELKVTLYRDDIPIKTVTTSESKDWEYSFSKQFKYHDNGIPYRYEVKEEVIAYYDSANTVTWNNNTLITDFTNTLQSGSVELIKQDENSNPMDGSDGSITFSLYTDNDVPVTSFADGIGYIYSHLGDDNIYTINDEGYIYVTNLPVGNYYFIETSTKEGYMPYEKTIEFTVKPSEDEKITITAKNNRLIIPNTGGVGNSAVYIFAIIVAAVAITLMAIYFMRKHSQKKKNNAKE